MDIENYRSPTEHAKINHLAIRCFRDTGDGDYIAARLAMRAGLAGQFLWAAEQAIEKYLKGILILNRVDTNNLGHDIGEALRCINTKLPFTIPLTNSQREVFDQIAEWGADRYLIGSFRLMGDELRYFDSLVWRLRQYCQPLDVIHYADDPNESVLMNNIKRIEAGLNGPAKNGHINAGRLERILTNKNDQAREPLVWKNFMYSTSQRKVIRFNIYPQAINSPLWLNPELAADAKKWMKIPRGVVQRCEVLRKERANKVRMD